MKIDKILSSSMKMDINHEEEGITLLPPLILQQEYATACVKLAVSHRDDSSLGIPELKWMIGSLMF
jgi:hypothetical protein